MNISSIIYKVLGVDIVTIMLAVFFICLCIVNYCNISKYLKFINEFINVEVIDFQRLSNDICEIIFCTKEQLKNDSKLIRKFYYDNRSSGNAKSLKIVGDEELYNTGRCLEFFLEHKIYSVPNMFFLENGGKNKCITLMNED